MNCVPIAIVNNNANAVLKAPGIFRANSFSDLTSCRTSGYCLNLIDLTLTSKIVEGYDYQFPNPGSNVVTQGSGPFRSDLTSPCSYNQNTWLEIGSNDVSTFSSSSSTSSSSATPTSPGSTTSTFSSSASVTSSVTLVSTSQPPINPTGTCTEGSTLCTTGYTFSMCSGGKWINYGNVAPGTKCVNGAIVIDNGPPVSTPSMISSIRTSSVPSSIKSSATSSVIASLSSCVPSPSASFVPPASCPTAGSMLCGTGGLTFYLCNNSKWVYYGNVAKGTLCYNGQIVFANTVPSSSVVPPCLSSSVVATPSPKVVANASSCTAGQM